MICLIVLVGCAEQQLISEDTIHIGVIGDNIEQFKYSNVIYESLEVEEVLTNDELNNLSFLPMNLRGYLVEYQFNIPMMKNFLKKNLKN